ncbi:hypothetical protein V494_07260 [Pseudogymnoascus sp. VKM F-4513 (FW-928)]|nr:hypothetical protein V494_07260 [Pseudogymnoascus sp. VKM F-4513 (FW-928)]
MNIDLPLRPANGRGDNNSSNSNSATSSGVGSIGDRGRPFFTSPVGGGGGNGALGGGGAPQYRTPPLRTPPQSEAEAIAGPVREVAPMNDRLIVGVDFGTTYSG